MGELFNLMYECAKEMMDERAQHGLDNGADLRG